MSYEPGDNRLSVVWDGKAFVPDGPVDLAPGERRVITLEQPLDDSVEAWIGRIDRIRGIAKSDAKIDWSKITRDSFYEDP